MRGEPSGKSPPLAVLGLLALALGPLALGPAARLHGRLVGRLAPVLARPLPPEPGLGAIRDFLLANPEPNPRQSALILGHLGRRYRGPMAAFGLALLWLVYRGVPGLRYRRRHDMASLLKVSARHFKCMAPVARCGPITRKADFKGEWALARSPLQLVLEEGLLLDGDGRPLSAWSVLDPRTGLPKAPPQGPLDGDGPAGLDLGGLRRVLAAQLGPVLPEDPRRLPDPHRGLAAALLAHWLGDKDDAMAVFDALSASWRPGAAAKAPKAPPGGAWPGRAGRRPFALGPLGRRHGLDLKAADAVLAGLDRRLEGGLKALAASVGHARYLNVWFMALLALARTKGALPSSMWIWLKPTDRTLFYALNQAGGRTAWAEAAGPWSHLEAERAAGRALAGPMVEAAVEAMERSLAEEGWLPRPPEAQAAEEAPEGPEGGGGEASAGPDGGGEEAPAGLESGAGEPLEVPEGGGGEAPAGPEGGGGQQAARGRQEMLNDLRSYHMESVFGEFGDLDGLDGLDRLDRLDRPPAWALEARAASGGPAREKRPGIGLEDFRPPPLAAGGQGLARPGGLETGEEWDEEDGDEEEGDEDWEEEDGPGRG